MSTPFNGDPAQMQAVANSSANCLSELEGQLAAMSGHQQTLQTALVSPGAGTAVQSVLTDAYTSGKKLAGTLQQIIDTLNQFGVQAQSHDDEARSRILNSVNAGGTATTPSIATVGPATQVDTASWT